MKQKLKKLIQEIGIMSLSLTIAFILLTGVAIVKGWADPTQAPPGGNLGAPINTSNVGQTKAGGLVLNTGGAVNGLLVPLGRVGIGTSTPAFKLDVTGKIHATGDVCTDLNGGKCLSSGSGSGFSSVRVVGQDFGCNNINGKTASGTVSCAAGEKVIGGGFNCYGAPYPSEVADYPSGNSWVGTCNNGNGGVCIAVYAICAK